LTVQNNQLPEDNHDEDNEFGKLTMGLGMLKNQNSMKNRDPQTPTVIMKADTKFGAFMI
jgi:hypothetical protein